MQEENEHIYTKFLKGDLSNEEKVRLKESGDLDVLNRIMSETSSWHLPTPKDSFAAFKAKKISGSKKAKSNKTWLKVAASIAVILIHSFSLKSLIIKMK